MSSPRNVGRIIGVLVFLHLMMGLTVPYILLQPMTGSEAGLLANGARLSVQVRLSVALLFIGGALPIAVAIAVWPMLRQRNGGLGLWLLALAVVNLALQVVENQHWLSMLSVSQAYSQAAASDAAFLQLLATSVRSAWRWAHYSHLLLAVGWMFMLYSILFRLDVVPRGLAALGIVTTVLQLGGITLPVLLGYRVPFRMEFYGMPLGAAYLVLSIWLMAKGLKAAGGPVAAAE